MNYNLLLALLFTGVLIFTGCDDNEVIEPSADETFGIRHDKQLSDYEAQAMLTGSDYPSFESVVFFNYSLDGSTDYEYIATGTLIDEDWILTAGHNFFVEGQKEGIAKASGVQVMTGIDPNNPDAIYEVEELVFHPTWIAQNDVYGFANDFCLVRLKTAITDMDIVDLYTEENEPIGQKVWGCGFGDYSSLSGQDPDAYSKKHAFENILDRKNTGIESSSGGSVYFGGLLAFDFDHPDGTVNTLGDDYESDDEKLLGGGTSSSSALEYESGTVEGDSGGPLFVKDGSTWKIAGVLSGGLGDPLPNFKDGNYGDISVYTRVSQSIDWIESVID